jgi:hypothetical protein
MVREILVRKFFNANFLLCTSVLPDTKRRGRTVDVTHVNSFVDILPDTEVSLSFGVVRTNYLRTTIGHDYT